MKSSCSLTCVSIPCWPHCSRLGLQPQHWLINSLLQPYVSETLISYRRPAVMARVDPQPPPQHQSQTQRNTSTLTQRLKSFGRGYSTATQTSETIIWVLLLLYCKPEKVLEKTRKDIQEEVLVSKTLSPLSRNNAPAVETWCQLHRTAPCSHIHSPPPPQSQRSGRWAPLRTLSPPRSITHWQSEAPG